MTLPWLLDLLTWGMRRSRITSSSVNSSGQGVKPPFPSGRTAGAAIVSNALVESLLFDIFDHPYLKYIASTLLLSIVL